MYKRIFQAGTALLALSFAICVGFSTPAQAADSGKASADAEILIKATPKVVWKAVHDERDQDPDIGYSRVISKSGDTNLLEQQFTGIPILGNVTAVTRQKEVPYCRIDYSLVNSDKFKSMEGSWVLTPANGGRETILQLSSSLDVGVPFSGLFIKNAAKRKVVHRIESVKQMAEAEQARLSACGRQDL